MTQVAFTTACPQRKSQALRCLVAPFAPLAGMSAGKVDAQRCCKFQAWLESL